MKRPVDPKKFGARVRARREELGMSQPKLAKESGISQQNIVNIEKGKVKRPGRLRELALALQTSQERLLWGEGPVYMVPQQMDEPLAFILRMWPTLTEAQKELLSGMAAEVAKSQLKKPA